MVATSSQDCLYTDVNDGQFPKGMSDSKIVTIDTQAVWFELQAEDFESLSSINK